MGRKSTRRSLRPGRTKRRSNSGSAEIVKDPVSGLSERDWAEIRGLAQAVSDKGLFDSHNGKCWVAGFILWEALQDDPENFPDRKRLRH